MFLVYVMDLANIRSISIHGTPTHMNICSHVIVSVGTSQGIIPGKIPTPHDGTDEMVSEGERRRTTGNIFLLTFPDAGR